MIVTQHEGASARGLGIPRLGGGTHVDHPGSLAFPIQALERVHGLCLNPEAMLEEQEGGPSLLHP